MKHFRKVCAVLLAMLMVAVILPSFNLVPSETNSTIPTVQAAEVGVVVNGNFSQSEQKEQQQKDDGCGNMETVYYNHATGWEQNKWGVNITGGYANFSKDPSVANSVGLWQLVPVNTNATYNLTFKTRGGNPCYTYKITGSNQDGEVLASGTPSTSSTSYKTNTVQFSTGSHNYVAIQFISTGTGSSDSRLDDVALTVVDSGDTGTHAKPTLKSFGTEKNRPAASSNNVIVQPGFESTTNAQWNTADFLKQGVSIETDASIAHSGSKYLKYYHGSVDYTEWPMFEITCPTAGEYVFSAWVRTPHLSATNVGAASIGIINPDTGKFLTYGNAGGSFDGHYSNTTTQLRSTATDDDWHLRSVTFYVGENNSIVKIGMYGLKSTMYVDDISVHLLTNGTKYVGDQTGTLTASTTVSNQYCEAEDSLIPDSSFNGNVSEDFWTKAASGWNNGFLEFGKDAQNATRKTSLHFKGTSPASNKTYRYIKFVNVEPNTAYTVSFDYRVVKAGNQLMFIDNNIEVPAVFHTPNVGSASNSWKTYAFTFNSGNYNRIGIVFKDGSGEAYYDDFRFFKNADGIATEPEEELFPTLLPVKHPDGAVSRTEENEYDLNTGNGLAFRFNLECTGLTCNTEAEHFGEGARYDIYYDKGTGKVDSFQNGEKYTLKKAGAVMTNDAAVGTDEDAFVLGNTSDASGSKIIDIFAQKAWQVPTDENGLTYVVRIINIPDAHRSTLIYARPYYVFEYEGREITVYGDIISDCYESYPDINDGWLEWD